MELNRETQAMVDKLRQRRQHLMLSVGIWKEGTQRVCTFDQDGTVLEGNSPRYEIGSITKTFTATMLAKQVWEGNMQLEDPLDKHIAGLPAQYYPSLRRMAVHASGYPSFLPFSTWKALKMLSTVNSPEGLVHKNPYLGMLNEKKLKELLAAHRLKDKEYNFAYNNFAFGALGYIVGKDKGGYWRTMDEYCKNELGLPCTWLGAKDTTGGYDGKNRPAGNWKWQESDLVAAAGGLTAPVEDVLRYGVMNLNEEKPWLALCHQKHGEGNKKWEMGLGWRLDRTQPIVWHDGNAGAFSAFVGFNRQTKTVAAALTNYGLISMQDIGFSILKNA